MSERILRFPELKEKIGGLSTVTIWRWEKEGTFPKRIRLGGNAVGWFESEIDTWLEQKAAER